MTTITREYAVEKRFKILGFNDDQCSCDVCGKQELKGTYAMEDLMTGEIFRAGSTCGAKMAGWSTKELVAKYKTAEKEKRDAAQKEFRASAEYAAYNNALDFLNKEEDAVVSKIMNTCDQEKRNELSATKRTFESRMNYIQNFSRTLEEKRKEILAKYNFTQPIFLS